ncbi:MAG: hypothetical protein HON42_04170, partial [Alphaproteobacteria bacterium]|jgi:hypothetical protein|nr:hypothetical protein [Alphaproteobacteria bacterium]MBT5827594.1 hypothetical protein [Alphaproteobacteria bacterium]
MTKKVENITEVSKIFNNLSDEVFDLIKNLLQQGILSKQEILAKLPPEIKEKLTKLLLKDKIKKSQTR